MLRCSNATAFRTQFTANMALRAPIPRALPWIGALQRLPPFTQGAVRQFGTEKREKRTGKGNRIFSAKDDLQEPSQPIATPFTPAKRKDRRDPRLGLTKEDSLVLIATNKGPSVSKKAIRMELVWLKDRAMLLEQTRRMLRRDNVAMAAALVREAQRTGYDTAASWNALLDYCMLKKNPRAAFKFWNDMKKRGCMPNEHAYTTMLHGLSKMDKAASYDVVPTARVVYDSLYAPNSLVKPSLIHTNAMLNVCAQHNAMDVLWEIAGALPEEGPHSPDSFTYTIILGGIRGSIQKGVEKLQVFEADKARLRRFEGVKEGKRVWADILYRWKHGQIALSNQLVSAMAGLLWEGTGDWHLYEVLQLYHQTAGLPILAKQPRRDLSAASNRALSRVGSDFTYEAQVKAGKAPTPEDVVPFVDDKGKKFTPTEKKADERDVPVQPKQEEENEENFDHLFDPVLPEDARPYTGSFVGSIDGPTYIPLGNRELSVILETCLQMTNAAGPGKAYWTHLTIEDHGYSFPPDHRSYVAYLRILRVARSSRLTAELLRNQMLPAGFEQGLPFHIALSTCRRDRLNPNVLKNANSMLEMMNEGLLIPDYRAIGSYLDLIKMLEDNPQDLVSLNGLDVDKQTASTKLETMGRTLTLNLLQVAVKNLRPLVAKLSEAMTESLDRAPDLTGRSGIEPQFVKKQAQSGAQVLAVLTRVRLLVDSILKRQNGDLLSKEARKELEEESLALRKYSDVDVIKSAKAKTVFPTAQQQTNFFDTRKPIPINDTPVVRHDIPVDP